MNGLDENKFDDILRSKLEGSSMEPPRDLLPNIMEAIDANNGAGGGTRYWVGGIVIGFLALSIMGYYVYSSFDSNQSEEIVETRVMIDNPSQELGKKMVLDNQNSSEIKVGDDENLNSNDDDSGILGSNESSEQYQDNEDVSNDFSIVNESTNGDRVVINSVRSTPDGQANEAIKENQVKVTEKSVVAKVLIKKTDDFSKEEVKSEINSSENNITDKIGAVSSTSSQESKVSVESSVTESNNSSEQLRIENQINASESRIETASSNEIIVPESIFIENSLVDDTNESSISDIQEAGLNSNTAVENSNESINNSDLVNSEIFNASGITEDELNEDSNHSAQNLSQEGNVANSITENQPVTNEETKNEIVEVISNQQSKTEFIDSLQTAIQSQVTVTNHVSDASTLELREKKWSIDLHAGPSMCYRTLDVEGDEDLQNHKDENESMLMTYSYSSEITRTLGNKWKVHIGAMYLRTGEKYAYSDGINTHEATNKYDYLAIPIGVDYSLFKTRKFEFLAGLGVQYNFLQKGVSSWLDPHNFSAQTHSNDDRSSPFNQQVLAWNAELGLRYRLTDRIDLIIKEEGILFNNSIYKTETGMDQREYSFETFIGLGYRF